ncbi:Transcription factor E2F6 [Seminavis robusta]|uniref:Transcription factor E2F6 n=1 Tax=Seminavis robusta TaxID=568900 RepID=A0A9N8HXF2_9STRA|nr:Transcription factor E2F6 [Seminavis robusta]|eukprot:Sro1799_g298340.1 Transcription factor E2F6 (735) ;mRNA; f:2004-4324
MEESLGTGANMNMNEGAPNQQQQQQQQQQPQQTGYQQYPSVPLYPVTATTGTAPVATNAVQTAATAYTAPATTTAAGQPYPGYYPATTATTTANNTGPTALPIWPTAGGAIAPYPVATATATNPYAAAQATTAAAAAGTSVTATNPYNAAQQTTAVTPYPSTTAARQSAKAAAAAYKAQQQQPGQRTVTTGYARNASARSPAQQSKHEAARQYALDANNATTTTTTANNTTAVRSPPTARAPPAANNTTTATATTATAAHHRQYDPYAYHYSYYYQYFSTQPRPKGYEGQWPPPPLPGFDYASPGYQQQLQQQQQQQQPTTTATKTAQNNNTTGKRASLSPKPRPTMTARPTNITTQQPPNNNNNNNKTASPPKMASPSRKETRKSTHKKDEEEDETAAAMDVTVGLLTRKFCSLIHASITGTIDLNEAAIQLGIQKKQVQEIADALEGIGLLEKRAKNTVVWKGALGASTAMASSSAAAVVNKPTEQDAHLKVAMERVRAKVDHYYREEAMLDCWISTLQSQMKQDEEDASKHLVQTGEGEHEHMPLNFVMSKDIIEAMYYPIQPIKPPKDATLIVKRPNTSKEPQSAIVAVHAPDGSLAEVSADTNNPNQPFPFQLSISQKSDLQKMVDRKRKAEANGEVVDPKRQHNSIEDGTNNNNNPIEVYLMPVEYNSKLDKMISSGAKVLPTSQMARQQEEETEMILSGQGPPEEEETTFTSPTLLPQEGVADFFHF